MAFIPTPPTAAPAALAPYMDARAAAGYLGITVPAVRRLVAARAISYVHVTARCMRFRRCDLDRFMDSRVVRAAS